MVWLWWRLLLLLLLLLLLGMLPCVAGMQTINVGRWLREVSLGFDQARLEIDDVVAELVVLGLDGFVVLVQESIVTDLLLEFLDISFFPLSEGSLREKGEKSVSVKRAETGFAGSRQ
jgi:hypothetical protein